MEVANPFIGLLQAFLQPTPSVTGGGGVCVCGGGGGDSPMMVTSLCSSCHKLQCKEAPPSCQEKANFLVEMLSPYGWCDLRVHVNTSWQFLFH